MIGSEYKIKKKYQIVYIDPPWKYRNSDCIAKTSCISDKHHDHYQGMNLKELCELPIKDIMDKDCLIFMWATCANLNEAFILAEAWGLKFGTVAFVWNKERVNPGYYTMSQIELCLVFKYGRIPQPRGARNIRQYLSEKRTKHSKKPDDIRNRIELMFPYQNKIEIFAREIHNGWDCLGNDIDGKDIRESLQELIS
jgi:N6-adenosine-specific RNA methylase IME4